MPILVLVGYFIEPNVLKTIPFDNTIPIHLINLLWKLKLGFKLDSELHYFNTFHGE